MRVCWNRQTGTFEGRVSYGVWVQVPSLAPKNNTVLYERCCFLRGEQAGANPLNCSWNMRINKAYQPLGGLLKVTVWSNTQFPSLAPRRSKVCFTLTCFLPPVENKSFARSLAPLFRKKSHCTFAARPKTHSQRLGLLLTFCGVKSNSKKERGISFSPS